MSENQEQIAVTKLQRAGKLAGAGFQVGGNYMKHYARKLSNQKVSKNELDEKNAKTIYETFSKLKGGPLKVAQMLSMSEELLPKAFTAQFAQAQSNVKPLSYPLIRKTFKKYFALYPEEVFESFSQEAINAASIGQVHQGHLKGKKHAIKIQYPGVADSIKSDLKMVSPVAIKLFGFDKNDIAPYLNEVETKLIEETDYVQELNSGSFISQACVNIDGLVFPKYVERLSNSRVLTMSWLEGKSLNRWLEGNPSQEERNKIGQLLWDFYQFQIHQLKIIHADPHPGNFIIDDKCNLGIIDFGCVKRLPEDFYQSYISLLQLNGSSKSSEFISALSNLEFILDTDEEQEKSEIQEIFGSMFELVGKPLFEEEFDFSDATFFEEIYKTGEQFSRDKKIRSIAGRGSKHFIYFNRTYFGLYQLLHQLKAKIKTSANPIFEAVAV